VIRLTVANDSPELLDLIGEVLASDRYVPTLLDSVEDDLLDRIRGSAPNLLLIDLRHGDDARRGWTIVQELRRTPEFTDLPVILCSADPIALSDLQADLCRATGVVTFALPFAIDDLLRTVRRLTDREEPIRWR
jgi:CheY-like chemotaxis protein